MNSSAHLTISGPTHKVRKHKARRSASRSRSSSSSSKNGTHTASDEPHLAAAGSLTRTKALLLAALRVWELKHRVGE